MFRTMTFHPEPLEERAHTSSFVRAAALWERKDKHAQAQRTNSRVQQSNVHSVQKKAKRKLRTGFKRERNKADEGRKAEMKLASRGYLVGLPNALSECRHEVCKSEAIPETGRGGL
jgi:hypothetical protein